MTQPAGSPSTAAPALDEPALLSPVRAVRDTGYRFSTITPATHARVNARASNAWSRSLRDVLGCSRPFRGDVMPAALVALMRRLNAPTITGLKHRSSRQPARRRAPPIIGR